MNDMERPIEKRENECVAVEDIRHSRDRADGRGADGELLSLEEEHTGAIPGGFGTGPGP